jgi:hypothetical protein
MKIMTVMRTLKLQQKQLKATFVIFIHISALKIDPSRLC